jgi:uncharacterized protein YndB with AHSA1/START domain
LPVVARAIEDAAVNALENLEAPMEINRNAPATAEGELQIDADPQTVFSVISAVDQWPSWNPDVKSVTLEGPVQPGTVFRWKSGPSSLTSTLQVVDPPHEIAWTGTTMGIKAVHLFRFQANDGGTLARSEESWEGLLASLLKGYSRKTLDRGIRSVLAHLKTEAERRAAAA